jgi:hypothetical protein
MFTNNKEAPPYIPQNPTSPPPPPVAAYDIHVKKDEGKDEILKVIVDAKIPHEKLFEYIKEYMKSHDEEGDIIEEGVRYGILKEDKGAIERIRASLDLYSVNVDDVKKVEESIENLGCFIMAAASTASTGISHIHFHKH